MALVRERGRLYADMTNKPSVRYACTLAIILAVIWMPACTPAASQGFVGIPTDYPNQGSTTVAPEPEGLSDVQPSGAQATGSLPLLLPTPTPDLVETPTAPVSTDSTPETREVQAEGFSVGNELTIAALRAQPIEGSDIVIEQRLADGANYAQYIASYVSEGNKIFGLLTVPYGEAPNGGFPAIVFNHGYIPPSVYRTTERYVAYVDVLARSGFVVFKIDLRGFGESEGEATGAYFSPGYTIDAISALKSLQRLDYVNPERIGMWGHSMAGNLVLRALLVEPDVKAGVIWAGAVYSYDDMVRYAIDDPTFRREDRPDVIRKGTLLREEYGPPNTETPYWNAVSLTTNIDFLQSPLQIHHALNDDVVNIGYSLDLVDVLEEAGKDYEFYQYERGGHNISSPYFSQAMQRTIDFFRANL
jgi:dienelactone hydrolase